MHNIAVARIALVLLLATTLAAPEAWAKGTTVKVARALRAKAGEPVGCIAGSLGRPVDGSQHYQFELDIYQAAKPGSRVVLIFVDDLWDRKHELRDGTGVRDTFVACLKPGRYEHIEFDINSGLTQFTQEEPFAVAIEVKPGTTTYIGSFDASFAHETDPCSPPGRLRVSQRDRSVADRPVLDASIPAGQVFEVALPDVSMHAPNLIHCKADSP